MDRVIDGGPVSAGEQRIPTIGRAIFAWEIVWRDCWRGMGTDVRLQSSQGKYFPVAPGADPPFSV